MKDEKIEELEPSCSNCLHYLCLVNQGIWGCLKDCRVFDAKTCGHYEKWHPAEIKIER